MTTAVRSAHRRRTRTPARRARAAARARGPGVVATLAMLLALAALLALGAWQLQRKVWKEALIGRIEALQSAPAEPLQAVLNRVPGGGSVDFVRVQTRCDGLGARTLHLYGLRAAGPGWRQITACRLPVAPSLLTGSEPRYRSVLVDLGFENEPVGGRGRTEAIGLPRAGASITGVLRTPDPPPWYAAVLGPARTSGDAGGEWMRRDVAAMAAALGAPDAAPFMLTLESPRAGPRLIPSPLPTDLPNRHLEYAVTWFGLAGVLVALYLGAWIRRGRAR